MRNRNSHYRPLRAALSWRGRGPDRIFPFARPAAVAAPGKFHTSRDHGSSRTQRHACDTRGDRRGAAPFCSDEPQSCSDQRHDSRNGNTFCDTFCGTNLCPSHCRGLQHAWSIRPWPQLFPELLTACDATLTSRFAALATTLAAATEPALALSTAHRSLAAAAFATPTPAAAAATTTFAAAAQLASSARPSPSSAASSSAALLPGGWPSSAEGHLETIFVLALFRSFFPCPSTGASAVTLANAAATTLATATQLASTVAATAGDALFGQCRVGFAWSSLRVDARHWPG